MAKKEAVFSLKVDTGNSVKDVQNFDKAVISLDKDLDAASKTAQSSAGLDAFSSKLDELDAKIASGTLTFREQTKVMKDYQTIASQAGAESPIGDRAIRSAAALKDELGDLQGRVKLLSSDYVKLDTAVAGIETGAAAYQGFLSVTALLGTENEQLVQTMVQLQAVQGAVNSLQTVAKNLNKDELLGIQLKTVATKVYNLVVGESTGAMKIFKIALASTGIGALIVGIGLLVANLDKMSAVTKKAWASGKQMISDFSDKYPKTAKSIKTYLEWAFMPIILAYKGAMMLYDALSGTTEASRKASAVAEANQKKHIKQLDDEKKARDENLRGIDRKIALLEAEGKSTVKLREEKIKLQKQEAEANLAFAEYMKGRMKGNEIFEQSFTDMVTAAKDSLNNIEVEEKKLTKEKSDLNKQQTDDYKAKLQEQKEAERDRMQTILELRNELLAEIEAAETAYFDSLLTEQQREEQAVTDKYFNLIEQAKQNGIDTTTLELAQESELAIIRKKADDDRLAKLAETEQQRLTLLRAYQSIVLDEYENELLAFDDQQTAQKKSLEEALSSNVITREQYDQAILKMAEQRAAKEKEINDKKNKSIADDDKNALKDKLSNMEKVIGYAKQGLDQLNAMNELANVIAENRINRIKEQSNQELTDLDAKQQAELSKEGLTADQKKSIEQKFAMQKYQVQLKAFNDEEAIKKQQFARDKKMKLASIAINTAAAIVKGIAEFGPPPSPLGIAAIAAAGVLGITQAAAVAAQNYQGGSAPTMPSTSAGGSMTGASASSFTTGANTNNQQTNLSNLASQASNPTQVVVLESDITNTQNKVKTIETLSSF